MSILMKVKGLRNAQFEGLGKRKVGWMEKVKVKERAQQQQEEPANKKKEEGVGSSSSSSSQITK